MKGELWAGEAMLQTELRLRVVKGATGIILHPNVLMLNLKSEDILFDLLKNQSRQITETPLINIFLV